MADNLLPKGYRTASDKTKFLGSLKTLSPAQQELRGLMVPDKNIKNESDINSRTIPELPKLKRLSDSISNGIQAQTNLREITPYIKRAEQIWLTLLLKPNGFEQELLQYDTVDSDLKNAKLHGLLLQKLKNYFSSEYPFQDELPQIIKDVMFRTGSYAILNLSHAALDHMINGMAEIEGKESFEKDIADLERDIRNKYFVNGDYSKAKNFGYIRKEKRPTINDGLEAIFNGGIKGGEEFNLVDPGLGWTFTDNPIILKVAELRNEVIDSQLRSNMGGESLDNIVDAAFTKGKGAQNPKGNTVSIAPKDTYDEFIKRMYPGRRYSHHESLRVRHEQYYTGSGRGVGTRFHIPSEACIPVHQNGEKTRPIGYILLVDPDSGNFLKTTGDISYYSSYKNRAEKMDRRSPSGSLNDIISNMKNISQGRDCEIDMDWAVDYVNGLLEKELVESFLNGEKAMPVTITLTEANKKLYLARAFKQQGVRSVFVPAESLTYFALDYNDFGVGKSLVEEAKMIITRIAILDIADTAANLANATSKTLLSMDLEEENFAPTELIYQAREKYLQNNPSILNYVGFAQIPIDRIVEGIKESLVRVKVNANDNSNIINPNFDEQQDNREGLKPVDNDSREKALNSLSSYFDLKRSWLEDSEQGNDFAIEALADQELLKNITIERSRAFSLLISDHFSRHVKNNEFLVKALVDIIVDNKELYNKPDSDKNAFKKDDKETGEKEDLSEPNKVRMVLNDFLNNLDIKLPIPASIETFNKLVDKLDAADKLVNGWKEIGIAQSLLTRTLKEMGLDEVPSEGADEKGGDWVMSIINSVLRREAYKKLGISIPFDEIVADGKSGGMMTFINDAAVQRENVVSFVEALFLSFAKGNKRIGKIAKTLKEKLEAADMTGDDDENNQNNEQSDLNNNTPPTDDDNFSQENNELDENNQGGEGEQGQGDGTNQAEVSATSAEKTDGTETQDDGNNATDVDAKLNDGLDFNDNIKI